ncbi:MAG: cation transporter [Candidatus Eisenbacteria sp.]|nr:cation transporter [Candidatus Eisenbacteria bacterium]
MNAYLYLIIALLLNAAANLLLKYSAIREGGAQPEALHGIAGIVHTYLTVPFLAGLACFALNVLIYTQALKKLPISVAYPLMVCGGYLIILLVSWFLFQERLPLMRYVGAGLMLTGLWFLVR